MFQIALLSFSALSKSGLNLIKKVVLKLKIQKNNFKTSLKIFKHYKLKPSFSIIKYEKAKDKVGAGDKPPPPSFNNLIKFDPI